MKNFSRRSFLQSSSTAAATVTFGGVIPSALQAAAELSKSERILVVIELTGGNDGLNTVIPYSDETYRKLRPKLAVAKNAVLKIDDQMGFHPSLRGFADLINAGKLAVVQGVGYPDHNRSHFESMDIWQTCHRTKDIRSDGWLGRMLETNVDASAADPAAIHLGANKQPLSLLAQTIRVPSIRSIDQFQLQGVDKPSFRDAIHELANAHRDAGNDLLDFVQSSTSSAINASERLNSAKASYHSSGIYPTNELGGQLQTVARLISSGLQTSVYYVRLGDFDSHSKQSDVHQGLLRQLGDSVKAFLDDIEHLKLSDRVTVMAFSEFGRRVAENASEGTDHGTAGPMFLAGSMVKAGLLGKQPSLMNLQDGDLKHHTDFRQVYASVIEDWFKCKSEAILKGHYEPVDIFKS